MTSFIFDEDDISLMEMPAFAKAVPKRPTLWDVGSKKRKHGSSQAEKKKGTNQEGCEKEVELTK